MAEGKVIKPTADEITETLGDAVFQVVTKAFETQDEFIFQTIRPFCETQAHMAITKDKLIRALTLLAEQEPVKPIFDEEHVSGRCGACGHALSHQSMVDGILVDEWYQYCPRCGRKVAWI